ncbi:MAG: hypothetical protein ACK5HL_02790 [Bacilli bacterium]
MIFKTIDGVEYISLGNVEEWVNDEHIADWHHPFKKRVAIKSMLFLTADAKKFMKKDSSMLCDLGWSSHLNTYILELSKSNYYYEQIVPDEYCSKKDDDIAFSFSEYCWENGGYDGSIDESINIYFPCFFLIKLLNLKQKNDYRWYDENDNLICFDTSLTNGINNLLIEKNIFLKFIEDNGFSFVWGMYYEKDTNNWRTSWRKNVTIDKLDKHGKIREVVLEKESYKLRQF